jgi:hypothetical protein
MSSGVSCDPASSLLRIPFAAYAMNPAKHAPRTATTAPPTRIAPTRDRGFCSFASTDRFSGTLSAEQKRKRALCRPAPKGRRLRSGSRAAAADGSPDYADRHTHLMSHVRLVTSQGGITRKSRYWTDEDRLPAVRIGRRVRVRRVDLDHVLAQGASTEVEPPARTVAPAEAVEQLTDALERARRLLDRLSGARRAEMVEGLQQLTETVAAAVETLSDNSSAPAPELE